MPDLFPAARKAIAHARPTSTLHPYERTDTPAALAELEAAERILTGLAETAQTWMECDEDDRPEITHSDWETTAKARTQVLLAAVRSKEPE